MKLGTGTTAGLATATVALVIGGVYLLGLSNGSSSTKGNAADPQPVIAASSSVQVETPAVVPTSSAPTSVPVSSSAPARSTAVKAPVKSSAVRQLDDPVTTATTTASTSLAPVAGDPCTPAQAGDQIPQSNGYLLCAHLVVFNVDHGWQWLSETPQVAPSAPSATPAG